MTAKKLKARNDTQAQESPDSVDTRRIAQTLTELLHEAKESWSSLSKATGMDKSIFSRIANSSRTAGIRTNATMGAIIDAFAKWGLDRDDVAERLIRANAIDRAPHAYQGALRSSCYVRRMPPKTEPSRR